MTLSRSVVSELLDAFRVGEGVDLIRDACLCRGVASRGVLVASWGSGRVALDMPADHHLADERGVGLSGSRRGVAHKRGVRVLRSRGAATVPTDEEKDRATWM